MSTSNLPPELLLQIISQLNNADLVNFVKSSRQFYALAIEQLYNSIGELKDYIKHLLYS